MPPPRPAPPTRRPPGRRPGESLTRQRILDAARARFAEDGYAGATIRKIAEDAGVDASLVMQFFGSKEELFGAVMSISPTALSRFSDAFDGPEELLGEGVSRAFFALWDGDPTQSEPLLAMLRAAVSNEQASAQLRGFLQSRLSEALAPHLRDDPDATIRVGVASSMLVGVILGRRIVQVPTLVNEDIETLVRLIAPGVQAVLTSGRARG